MLQPTQRVEKRGEHDRLLGVCLREPRCHVAPFVERQLDVRLVALTGLVWVLGFGI